MGGRVDKDTVEIGQQDVVSGVTKESLLEDMVKEGESLPEVGQVTGETGIVMGSIEAMGVSLVSEGADVAEAVL